MRDLTKGDQEFVRLALRYFRIMRVRFRVIGGYPAHPDIWSYVWEPVPVIVATQTWARKSPQQRRIEIVHEFCHISGTRGHSKKLGFSTYPEFDTYSKKVYSDIISNARLINRCVYKFDRRRFV